ncbi:hypothetical protein GCM10010440_20270 [Kitasatospora cinereorecta]
MRRLRGAGWGNARSPGRVVGVHGGRRRARGSRNPALPAAALPIREPSGLSAGGTPSCLACGGVLAAGRGWGAVSQGRPTGVLKAQKDPGATLPGSLTPRA